MIIEILCCNEKIQKGGTMISKKVFITLGLSCLLLFGCQAAHKIELESSALTPTGYASEEVQQPSLFYDGALYLYNATGFDLPKEDGWELLGQVISVNNLEWPAGGFHQHSFKRRTGDLLETVRTAKIVCKIRFRFRTL